MLQRVRDALYDIEGNPSLSSSLSSPLLRGGLTGGTSPPPTKRKVNLIHRLDRGASGALLFAYAEDEDDTRSSLSQEEEELERNSSSNRDDHVSGKRSKRQSITTELIEAMSHPNTTKTYLALVRGEGVLRGEDLVSKGWLVHSGPFHQGRGRCAT